MVDPASRTTTYTYDAANEQTAITYSDGLTPNVTSITYDADGQRTAMTDGTGTSSWVWDSLHRITSSTNGAGQTVDYGYDLKGQLTTLTYPNSKQVTRVYDDAGHLTSVTDWLNHTTSFGYDANSNLSSDTYANGTVATIGVDNADEPLSIADTNGSTTLASFTYTRNADEMLASASSTGVGQSNQTYGYTKLNQVGSVNTGTYTYDAADNLRGLASGATTTYDVANEATSLTTPGNPATDMAYDSSGNRMTGSLLQGQPSTFTFDQANRLTQVGDQEAATQVTGGDQFSVDLKSDGTVWAWGDNSYGQLGNGTTTSNRVPGEVANLSGITAISAESHHVLALKSDGTVWAWGRNDQGQLGNGTTTNSDVPIQVPGLTGMTAIAAGGGHSLAVKSDGTLWAWGENDQGEVGIGTTTNVLSPVQVTGLVGATSISAGTYTSLAVKSDGTVWAWGYNGDGELGNGTYNNSTTPTQVPGLTGMTSVAAGDSHSLALKNDGTVWSWGLNDSGELGNGTTNDSLTPVEVSNLTGVTKIAAGWAHSLAIQSNGAIWDWGYNSSGQLGNASGNNSDVPVQPEGLTGVTAIAGGGAHSLAVRADATVWAWGANQDGELGYPDHECSLCSTIPLGVIHSVVATYAYDGDGSRAATTTGGTAHHFAWDASASLPLLLTDGSSSYIYGPGGAPIEQIDSSSNAVYLHQDALGSTRLLTDQAGSVAATFSYDAYGNVTASSGTATTPFMFTGQYRDAESGLYYLRARYYDSTTAQFLSRDPLVAATRSPYGYVGDNPVNGSDPEGLCGLMFWTACNPDCPDSVQPLGPWQCNGAEGVVKHADQVAAVADKVAALCGVIGQEECSASATGYSLLFQTIATGAHKESPAELKEAAANAIFDELLSRAGTLGDIASRLDAGYSLLQSLPSGTDYCTTFDTTTVLNSGAIMETTGVVQVVDGQMSSWSQTTQIGYDPGIGRHQQ
jgi:RHS repeat-associated protein